jgi:hypothetical protein
MILRPALRFLTGPRPPGDLAARRLAAVILPPLLFFAIVKSLPFIQVQFCLKADFTFMENGSVYCRPVSFEGMERDVQLMT